MATRTVSRGGPRPLAGSPALAIWFAFALSAALGSLAVLSPSASATPTVYVANFFSNSVSAYSIGSNGGLSPVAGSPFPAGGVAPLDLAVSPDGEHMYSSNLESNTISAFTIGANGALSPVPGSPFTANVGPWGVAVSPDGAYLYAANHDSGSVSAYSLTPSGGLVAVAGSPFSTGSAPGGMKSNGVAITPDGKHLYVTNQGPHNISAFTVASDGGLSPVTGSPFAAETNPRGVSVTPDGNHLYVANRVSNTLSAYAIASDGSLSPVSGSPFTAGGSSGVLGVAASPNGGRLYVTNPFTDSSVSVLSIDPSGSLSSVAGSPFPTGNDGSTDVAVSPDGKNVYVTLERSRSIAALAVAANGSLSAVAGSPFAAGAGAGGLAVTPDQGPLAAFSATPTPAGNASAFDASASSDPDGAVASYHWDFGDGQTQVTSNATTAHPYTSPGDYTVTLTAVDDNGCSTAQTFTGQTVSCNGSPLARISHEVTVPPGVPLGTSLTGSGSGSVTSSPSGIACPGACSYAYEPGTQVTLAAGPSPGSTFTGWSGGGCSGLGSNCEVNVTEAQTVEAEFTVNTYALDVAVEGVGEVNSIPAGIGNCGTPTGSCDGSYDHGSVVTLAASPAANSAFSGWSGGGCSGTGTCEVTMNADTEITAVFGETPQLPPSLPAHTLPGNLASLDGPPMAARLRINRVRSRVARGEARIAVGGTIVKPARGVIGVTVGTGRDGRRVTAIKRARIADGRWRARLALPGLDRHLDAPISVIARFVGSPGVRSGHAKRRVASTW